MRTYFNTWGAVDSVTDIARNRFDFTYTNEGLLSATLYPGGVRQTRTYDQFGRDATDRIVRPGSTVWPFFQDTLLRNFSVSARNARGQILTAADAATLGGAVPSAQYDSVGHLIRARLLQPGYASIAGTPATYVSGDTTTYDGLGNILSTRNGWALGSTISGDNSQSTYAAATGRLVSRLLTSPSAGSTTLYGFDAAGNARFDSTLRSPDGTTAAQRASYYGADDRLVATDSRTPGRQLVEEYRYDALGRRVWVSTRWRCAPTSSDCIANAVLRTVWDGASEVAEIRQQYDTSAAATEELDRGAPLLPKSLVSDANPFYGRVVYGPGLALDQPLSVTRFEYRDNPVSNDALVWPSFTVLPFWDYRGVPVFGLFSDGAYRKPYDATGHTQCPDSPGTGTTDRCVYLTWPFAGSVYHQDRGLVQTFSWQGSLLQKKRDVSGLTYARNRMYDPQTGRFTQEDPIGLAGGLNAYGYANGDPVNYSDPFGLCPPQDNNLNDCPGKTGALVQLGRMAPAINQSVGLFAGVSAVGGAIGAAFTTLVGGGASITTLGLRAAPAAGAGAAAAGRIANGDFERTFETGAGAVRVFGEAVTDGRTLTLNNFMVYPDNASRLQSGVSAMRAGFRGVADAARAAGYDQIIVNFHRTSGANAGKISQQVIDLKR